MLWGDAQSPIGQAQVTEPCHGAGGVMTGVPVMLPILAIGAIGSGGSQVWANGRSVDRQRLMKTLPTDCGPVPVFIIQPHVWVGLASRLSDWGQAASLFWTPPLVSVEVVA